MPSGRKSLKEELQVVRYMAELQPRYFKVLKEALEDSEHKYWAAEQLSKLFAKAVPTKFQGDDDHPLAIKTIIINKNGGSDHKPAT